MSRQNPAKKSIPQHLLQTYWLLTTLSALVAATEQDQLLPAACFEYTEVRNPNAYPWHAASTILMITDETLTTQDGRCADALNRASMNTRQMDLLRVDLNIGGTTGKETLQNFFKPLCDHKDRTCVPSTTSMTVVNTDDPCQDSESCKQPSRGIEQLLLASKKPSRIASWVTQLQKKTAKRQHATEQHRGRAFVM